jgi:hypothetical protein
MTEALAKSLMDDHGLTPDAAKAFVDQLDTTSRGLAAKVLAGRIYNTSALERARNLTNLSEASPQHAGLRQQADEAIHNLITSFIHTNNTQTEVARALEQYNIQSSHVALNEREAARIVKGMETGGALELSKLRRALATADDTRTATNALKWFDRTVETSTNRALSVLNEWYVNSLLGGLKTHITNLTSQSVQTLLLPAYRAIGGAASGDVQMIKSGFRAYSTLIHTAMDIYSWTNHGLKLSPDSALSQAAKAWLREQPILTASTKLDTNLHAISATNLGIENKFLGTAVDWLGKAVRLPSRTLTGADEFFKQLNYRAWLRDEAYQEAMKQGLETNPQRFAQFVGQYIEDGFDAEGRAKSDLALRKAKEATFTQDLLPNSLTSTISNAALKHPMLRQVIPFIKVPSNLLKTARDFTPGVNFLFKEFRDQFFSSDAAVAADARGRAAVGTAFWTLAGGMALSGQITGGGPKDPERRNALMATGWRPYSIKVGDQYLDYKRGEPFSMLLGLAADFAEIRNTTDDATASNLAKAMTVALAKNLTNKTYVNSMAEVLNVLANPDPSIDKFLQQRAAVYAVPGMVANGKYIPGLQDDALHEVSGYMDAIKNRLPGYANDLPPRRDMFGEAINPPVGYLFDTFRHSTRISDPVKNELARLEYGFSMPPTKLMGVDLKLLKNTAGRQAYDRYVQLQGEVKIGGKTLPEALTRTIDSDRYKSLPDPEGPQDTFNGKVRAVQEVIGRYREAAAQQLIREFPEIRQMKNALDQRRRDAQRPASNVLQLLAH